MRTAFEVRMTPKQVDRLNNALQFIRENPEKWGQTAWFALAQHWNRRFRRGGYVGECTRESRLRKQRADCGSKACLAGHLAFQSGWDFVLDPHETTTDRVAPHGKRVFDIDADTRTAQDVAGELIGLDVDEEGGGLDGQLAEQLFDSDCTLDMLHAFAYLLSDGRTHLTKGGRDLLLEWGDADREDDLDPIEEDYVRRHGYPTALQSLAEELQRV